MGRLFWKFFFSYWAALLATVVGVSAAVWVYQLAERRLDSSLEAGPRASFVIESAASTLRHGGGAALYNLMSDWGRRGKVWLYAVDEKGADLLGRTAPPDAIAGARALAASGEQPDVSRVVRSSDGEEYLLFVPAQPRSLLHRLLLPVVPPSPMVPLVTGIIASLVFGAVLAWYVARPIRHLRQAFAALSQGRLETRVEPLIGSRRDEVADLGRHFDRMAGQIQALIGSQRSLLHDVSHELRSPLARLQAAIGLARQNPDKLETSLERIEREAERLDDLVGQILTLSRLETSTRPEPTRARDQVDLVDLVSSIAADADFEASAEHRRVAFSAGGEILVDVHAELLHRAIENVVRNAVKYTRPESTVEVTLAHDAGRRSLVLTVCDRGPGVPDAELGSIFEPFYRIAGEHAGRGFGLGLAVARRAVEAHGGTVTARNREGGGLEVEIRLPDELRVTEGQ